jgi:serine/threonine protein kinase
MNCIIANKYEIIEEVGQGTFGKVFRGKHIRTNEDVAIKIQFKSILNVLQHEAKLYKHLENSIGIPTMRNYGHEEGFHYLILDYLDKPLDKLEMTPSECISYFIEAVNVLETIHTLGILHRDIKPDNLMIKERSHNANQLYVIDFGLSKWFLDSSGNHMKEKTTKTMVGTIKYSSINVHNGIEPSRRDDLESLCYTFMSLYGKELMWVNVCEELKRIDETDETQEPKKKLVCEKIKTLKLEDTLFFELPDEFQTIVFYVRNLSFEEKPNYKYMINVLKKSVNTGSDTLEPTAKGFNKEDYNGV